MVCSYWSSRRAITRPHVVCDRHLHHLCRRSEPAEGGSREEQRIVSLSATSGSGAAYKVGSARSQSENEMRVINKLANDYVNFCKECCMYASVRSHFIRVCTSGPIPSRPPAKCVPSRTLTVRCRTLPETLYMLLAIQRALPARTRAGGYSYRRRAHGVAQYAIHRTIHSRRR